ncbi:extracellular solute-binding protein [Paenibacillus sp. M1]|uniref:Extracellular solute-binding protein n=1 Tax=Paenibacillus haidiansis TaxID=1574488 RepID=A0ABU7VLQ3_9BACL
MKRKNHWVLFAILLLALINLSPSETSTLTRSEDYDEAEPVAPQNQETEQDLGTISVAVQLPEDEFLRLQQINEKVMDEYRVQVELTNLPPEDNEASIRQKLALGDSPDILLLNNAWIRRFASAGYLLPTESYYSGSLSGEVLSASLNQSEWNGYIWAVPMDADPYVLIYNPESLKKLGTELPASKNAWQDLIAAFKKQQSSPYIFALDYRDPYAFMSLLWQLTGQAKPAEATSLFKPTEDVKAAVEQLDELRPNIADFLGAEGEEGIWNKLYNGEAVFALVKWSDAASHPHANIRVVYPDRESQAGAMWIGGRSYAVSARSDNTEAAGVWTSAMTSQLQQRTWYDETGYLPVLKTMYYQAARNGLPSWIPASLVNGKGTPLPAGAGIPSSMEKYAQLSSAFLNGELGVKPYLERLNEM